MRGRYTDSVGISVKEPGSSGVKAKIHYSYTSFPVASPQQVGNFPVYGEVTGKRDWGR